MARKKPPSYDVWSMRPVTYEGGSEPDQTPSSKPQVYSPNSMITRSCRRRRSPPPSATTAGSATAPTRRGAPPPPALPQAFTSSLTPGVRTSSACGQRRHVADVSRCHGWIHGWVQRPAAPGRAAAGNSLHIRYLFVTCLLQVTACCSGESCGQICSETRASCPHSDSAERQRNLRRVAHPRFQVG